MDNNYFEEFKCFGIAKQLKDVEKHIKMKTQMSLKQANTCQKLKQKKLKK